MPRQELVVAAREGLALVTELLAELLAFGRAIAPTAANVVRYPPAHPRCPSFRDRSGHVREARFAEVSPRDRIPLTFRRLSCPLVRYLIPFHVLVPRDPSKGKGVFSAFQPFMYLHQGNGKSLPRAHLV